MHALWSPNHPVKLRDLSLNDELMLTYIHRGRVDILPQHLIADQIYYGYLELTVRGFHIFSLLPNSQFLKNDYNSNKIFLNTQSQKDRNLESRHCDYT